MISLLCVAMSVRMFSQTNATVDIYDDVYETLIAAQIKGLCGPLPNVRPYTQGLVLERLEEILENLENMDDDSYAARSEIKIIQSYISRFERKAGLDLSKLNYRIENDSETFPVSFNTAISLDGFFSGGLYASSSQNSGGYEVYGTLDFSGDFGRNIGYMAKAFLELTKMPLTQMGEYYIGNWWYSTDCKENFEKSSDGWSLKDPRYIRTWRNYSVLPYSYKKHWDGVVYPLSNLSATGLSSWPTGMSLGFGMYGEIHGVFFDGHLELAAGRLNREWGAMDEGASLVLNAAAHPFFAAESVFRLFDFLSLSSLFGTLEAPYEGHVTDGAWELYDREWDENGYVLGASPSVKDTSFFQNLFAMAMLDLDFKYVHFDFGSTCVLPKRFEFGYAFPLIDRVVYQNDLGDFDNLALFANLKLQYPGIGQIWFSLFADDITSFKARFWEQSWCAYAWQAGAKASVPLLPFMTVSFRYTKVEPYCYTHTSTKVPWYTWYVSTSYTNNGASLGYYLQPNSDEFLLRVDARPAPAATVGLGWQFIRHGTDFGSGAVPGSNLYSELVPGGTKADKKKYFLHDGTYEWTNIISLDASYHFYDFKVPVRLNASVGYVFNWFTGVDNNGERNASYHYINEADYPEMSGFVVSVGFSVSGR